MHFYLSTFLLLSFVHPVTAQQSTDHIPASWDPLSGTDQTSAAKYRIEWLKPITINSEDEVIHVLNFSTAQYAASDGLLPRHYQDIGITGDENDIAVSFFNTSYEPLSDAELALLKNASVPQEIALRSGISYVRKQKKGSVSFIPLRKNATTGKIEKLVSYDLLVSARDNGTPNAPVSSVALKLNSVLKSGKWYKIAVAKDGAYKISYNFLKQLGMDPETVNPKNIRIYGNGGGMLPKFNAAARADDLLENAIVVEGENDGVFNKEDYILFYGQSPHRWKYNKSAVPVFQHIPHLFSDSTYYFINADLGPGKRISAQVSSTLPVTHMVTSFDDYAVHENDNKNLINSGNKWFGEFYDHISSYDFSFHFPFIESTPVAVKVSMAGRYSDTSIYYASCQSGSVSFFTSGVHRYTYADLGSGSFYFNPVTPDFSVNVTKKTEAAIAWLDYIEVHVRRKLVMTGDQLAFRDINSVGVGNRAGYSLSVNAPVHIWDVTDPSNVLMQDATTGNTIQFVLPADSLKEFLAYTGQSFLTPGIYGAVENQNLHAIPNKDFVIVTHPDFLPQAQELAAIHEREDKLSTIVVTPQQIYNEFSSGAQDITAIRDFVRMFYNRANNASELPKYLLLVGDGSYDNKKQTQGNTNFIPTHQSDTSTDLTTSFVSDDYYGVLDNKEGVFLPDSYEAIDIGIGRFPVKSKAEAQVAINKIIQYMKTGAAPTTANNGCSTNQSTPFGDWRNTVCLVADDDDMNLHLEDAEKLSDIMTKSYKTYNLDKIYLDAYKQESTPGGERYPDVNAAIDKRMEKGCLIFNYTGHGGEVGLAHERIVDISMINKWSNSNNLPLFFTATCEFSRYDDPARTSAGEYVFLNPRGGAIALFTTVRLVYASFNSALNQSFMNAAFKPGTNEVIRLGDIFQRMKSESINLNLNSRNFSMLGDPALRLSLPAYDIVTDSVNNSTVTAGSTDTLKGLSLVTIAGHLETNGTAMTNYNGVLYPTVFNKVQYHTTLSNNPPDPSTSSGSPAYTFPLQKNVLYKGKASVTNGRFKYEFIVPKDIGYQYGVGRISYYAENGKEDANGYYDKIIVGGINDSAATDHKGPEISLYMNDVKFISGGTTSESPDLFAILNDANGINTVGNSIGHDIIAILDANTDHSIVLNDYYQADLNSYQSGTIRYQFKNLPEGKHTLSLKAWDVYNNSSLATTEFVVSPSAELLLNHVLNYPNPFTTRTQFFFEHNQCCQLLNVQLQVFTISGKLVKNISKYVQAEGYRSDPIEWDGRDDFGDRIGRGVYIYRLRVRNSKGATAEKYEKLVIL
jgi:hypothetical protein